MIEHVVKRIWCSALKKQSVLFKQIAIRITTFASHQNLNHFKKTASLIFTRFPGRRESTGCRARISPKPSLSFTGWMQTPWFLAFHRCSVPSLKPGPTPEVWKGHMGWAGGLVSRDRTAAGVFIEIPSSQKASRVHYFFFICQAQKTEFCYNPCHSPHHERFRAQMWHAEGLCMQIYVTCRILCYGFVCLQDFFQCINARLFNGNLCWMVQD